MTRILLLVLLQLCCTALSAQDDKQTFRAYLYNNEYDVYLRINFYDQDVEVPGQPLYGKLPGFLGKVHNSFCWVITSCKIKNEREAELDLINDFGSDDLHASLFCHNDSTYVLHQAKGNALKVPKDGKWQRLPKYLVLKRKK